MDSVKDILNAAHLGKWALVTLSVIIVLVEVIKAYGPKIWAPLGSNKAGWYLAVVMGAAMGVSHALMAGATLVSFAALQAAYTGAITGLAAAGLYKGGRLHLGGDPNGPELPMP